MSSAADYIEPTTFRTHREIEVNCITDLTRLRDIAGRVGLEESVIELIESSLQRSKENKFSIAVVGEFKRGKSTFINALLGKEVLPADILPCSATLNRVTYGLQPSVTVVYRDDEDGDQEEKRDSIELDQLTDYVTKLTPESEQRASQIREAIVHYPLPYCQNNVDIIDTPGLNDDATMTEVTLSVLPNVSAAILVIMATSPFSAYEADFLNNQLLLQDLGRVIFVVTAIDLIRKEEDRQRIVEAIRKRIKTAVEKRLEEQFGEDTEDYKFYLKQIGEPKVFPVSGYLALEAKEQNDASLMEESGFPQFEASIEKFITETRGVIQLQVLANRILNASGEMMKKIAMEAGALEMEKTEFDEAYERSMNELETLRQRRDEETRRIDEAASNTKFRMHPLIEQMEREMQAAAVATIEETEVKADDIKKDTFKEQLGQRVTAAIQTAARRGSERIQVEVERDLVNEVQRLGGFASEVNEVLQDIEMKFTKSTSVARTTDAAGSALAVVVGGLWSGLLGGAIAGYQEAGSKGAAVGGATGFAAAVAGFTLLSAIGVTGGLVLPAVIAVGAGSTLLGKIATRQAFSKERVNAFKQEYKQYVLEQLNIQLQSKRPSDAINQQIMKAYQTIKERLLGELDASIEQIHSNLEQLRQQKARQDTIADQKKKENEELLEEITAIRNRAQTLASYLVEISHV
jgi:GTPase SAR1 family protein